MPITSVKARQIFDSRGYPTIEVDISTKKGTFRASVPSGHSPNQYAATEMRDGGESFMGQGVRKAIQQVNKVIGPALIQLNPDVTDQRAIDNFLISLDGTENKEKLGANAIMGLSMAACRAGAGEKECKLYRHISDLVGTKGVHLPVPAFNVINGGNIAGNALAIQEFLLLPISANSFKDAMRMGTECFHHLKKLLDAKYGQIATLIGEEGGFTPNLSETREALDFLTKAIDAAGLEGKVMIGISANASQFYRDGKYDLNFKSEESDPAKWLSVDELTKMYKQLVAKYPVVFIEDPFDSDDWEAFANLTSVCHVEISGAELLASHPKRVQDAVDQSAVNCLTIQPSQIGTVSEVLESCRLAQEAGWGVVVSHRTGDTEDAFISDLAVGIQAGHFKAGAPCRSERLAKYNQMLRIEEHLGVRGKYVGPWYRTPKKYSLMDTSTAV